MRLTLLIVVLGTLVSYIVHGSSARAWDRTTREACRLADRQDWKGAIAAFRASATLMQHERPAEARRLYTLNELAITLCAAGDLEGAIPVYEQLLTAMLSVASASDPTVRRVAGSLSKVHRRLAVTYLEQKDWPRAREILRKQLVLRKLVAL